MKQLQSEFRKNDLAYRIVKRSDTRYIAEISGGMWLETGRIIRKKAKTISFGKRRFEVDDRETIPDNEHFAKDPAKCEKCMRSENRKKIEQYFSLGNAYDFLHAAKEGTPKVVSNYPEHVFPPTQGKKSAYVPRVANTVQTA